MPSLSEPCHSEADLNELMSRPTPALVEQLARGRGDLVLLGIAGKMGVTLGLRAVRALREAGSQRRVVGVARFSDPLARTTLEQAGVTTIACDLLDREAVARLPDAEDVIHLAGRKFGTSGPEADLTWAMNAVVPANVVHRYATSRIVALSTGCVYPLATPQEGGCDESVPPAPCGEYAMSALARERVFSWASRAAGTRVCLIRLNYALDLRYGVIHDIAQQVAAGAPVDRSVQHFNGIGQGDANRMILQSLELCSAPATVLNLTGPETLSVESTAHELGRLLGKEVAFAGEPSPRMYLSDASLALDRFGYPTVAPATIIRWTAAWIAAGGRSLGKPTHFQTTDGRF
jgi:nucleoside-diphosphate-sugar epimerase